MTTYSRFPASIQKESNLAARMRLNRLSQCPPAFVLAHTIVYLMDYI